MEKNNTINGRTPEEIKKWLEHCATEGSTCKGCVFCADCDVDIYAIDRYALALIEQLERERDELKQVMAEAKQHVHNALRSADRMDKQLTQLESAQPKWISVEERLPEESETVLVYRDGCYGVARLLDVEPVIMWTYTGFGGDPTHWRPLPEPPGRD